MDVSPLRFDSDHPTRDRIIRTAVEAFGAKGFHGTTTRDIAAGADLSAGSIYVHFRSKEELFYVICRTGHEHTLAIVLDALKASNQPTEQLTAFVRNFVAYHATTHTSARVINYELAALTDAHAEEIAGFRREIQYTLQGMLNAGVAAGQFHTPDVRTAARALLSLGIDTARWYRDAGDLTPDQVAEDYCDVALRIVGATDQDGRR